MIAGYGPITQTLLGTLLTWGSTAAGAACIIFLRGNQRKSLDASLGFAAGVMVAASFWSLLSPAIEMAENSHIYGAYAFFPVSVGFLLGAIFVFGCDKFLNCLSINTTHMMLQIGQNNKHIPNNVPLKCALEHTEEEQLEELGQQLEKRCNKELGSIRVLNDAGVNSFPDCLSAQHNNNESTRRRKKTQVDGNKNKYKNAYISVDEERLRLENADFAQWKRIMLLVVAITVHNIPEGLAVGVSFGAIGSSNSSTFESARNLAIGIGIQNFPEGLAVSLPLHAAGFSLIRAFWYGQLSGMVEPIFGVLGAIAVALSNIILPYALAFAAGAMIYIVADDILPEAHASGNGSIATCGTMIGFLIMMCLEVTFS